MSRKKEIKGKLGPRVMKKKNPFLNPDGGIDLIDKFPGTDYLKYSIKKGREKRKR